MGPHNENHLRGLQSQCDIKHFVTLEFRIVDKCREENFWHVVFSPLYQNLAPADNVILGSLRNHDDGTISKSIRVQPV